MRQCVFRLCTELRQGWNSFLEEVIAHTGNYLGFHFLDGSQVPVGTAPGI